MIGFDRMRLSDLAASFKAKRSFRLMTSLNANAIIALYGNNFSPGHYRSVDYHLYVLAQLTIKFNR